jgi:uncharacterized coiled-coil protein SlyX
LSLRRRIDEIESSLQHNKQTVNEIKQVVKDLANHGDQVDWKKLQRLLELSASGGERLISLNTSLPSKLPPLVLSSETCSFADLIPPKPDVQVMNKFALH